MSERESVGEAAPARRKGVDSDDLAQSLNRKGNSRSRELVATYHLS